MADEDTVEPVFRFFAAWFGFTLAVFPLVATVDSVGFGGSLGSTVVLVASVVVALPAALEFLFAERNPRLVGVFVVVFAGLYFLVLVGQAAAYVTLDRSETVPAVEVGLLLGTYAVTYLLVYRGGLARLRGAVGW